MLGKNEFQKLIKNFDFILLGVSKLLSVVSSLLLIRVLSSYFSNYEFGIWITISSISNWMLIFDFGIGLNLKNEVVKNIVHKNFTKLKIEIGNSYLFVSSFAIIIFLIIYIIFKYIFSFKDAFQIKQNSPLNGELSFYILICSSLIILVLKNIQFVLQGIHKSGIAELINAIFLILTLIFCYLINELSFEDNKILLVTIIYSTIPITVLVISSFFIWKTKPYLKPIFNNFNFQSISKIAGIDFFLIQLSNLIMFSTDNYLISKLINFESVAVYNIPFRYFGILNLAFSVLLIPIWPKVANYYHTKKNIKIIRIEKRLKFTFVSILLTGIIMLSISNYIYSAWVGNKIIVPINLSITVLIYFVVLIWGTIYGTLLNGMGLTKFQRNYSIIQSLLNIPLCYFFSITLKLGLIGIPISTIVCLFFGNVLITRYYHKTINLLIK